MTWDLHYPGSQADAVIQHNRSMLQAQRALGFLTPRQLARRQQTHLFYHTAQLNQNYNMFYKTVHCTRTLLSAIQLQFVFTKVCKMYKNTPEHAFIAIFQHSWTEIILLPFSIVQSVTAMKITSKTGTLTQGQSSFSKEYCHVTLEKDVEMMSKLLSHLTRVGLFRFWY